MAPQSDLEKQLHEKDRIIAELQAIIVELRQRIADLERQLGLNSSNSGKPPASDGLKKPSRVQSLREKSGKKSGGQPGHKGVTLQQVEHPDFTKTVSVASCPHCQTSLEKTLVKGICKRQVFDLPKNIKAQVTEYKCEIKKCPNCLKTVIAQQEGFSQTPVQYGPNVKAMVVYLYAQHMIPEDRLAQIMEGTFGLQISVATIESMLKNCANTVAPIVNDIEVYLLNTDVKAADESGFTINGKLNWLHALCNSWFAHYRISTKRGDVPQNAYGIVTHDHFYSYFSKMLNVQHALCNAHHLRELKAVVELDKEAWAKSMAGLLLFGYRLAKNRPNGVPLNLICKFKKLYNSVISEGLAYHENIDMLPQKTRGKTKRRPGHNLLLRLKNRADDTLRFLENPAVPFTNNLAEQSLRMIKVKQKISGGFRTINGAKSFLTLKSYTATAQKHGINVLDALSAACNSTPVAFC